MLKYIARRILIFIPTLFAISLIAFVISINAPGDPIETLVTGANGGGESGSALNESMIREKDTLRHKLGLDLPVFYFTMTSVSTPDTLYKIYDKDRHASLERLIDKYGDWQEISAWYLSMEQLKTSLLRAKPDSAAYAQLGTDTANAHLDQVQQEIISLLVSYDDVVIANKLGKIEKMAARDKKLGAHNFLAPVDKHLPQARAAFEAMKSHSSTWKNYVPAIRFYGYNQYHRWLFGDGNWLTGNHAQHTSGVIRGDFGTSYATKQAVTKTIKRAIPWSMFFTLASVLLAYLVSIPIGIQAAANRGGFFDRASSVLLFMLYSLPSFFMATLLLMTFANPEMFDVFPANGVKPPTGYPDGISMFEKLQVSFPYLVLPLFCYTYSSLAFLSRTTRVSMLETLSQDYIRTARAKGLSRFLVVYKHGFGNGLLPIITVFSNIFPAAVGGSVILEFIFGIPGMGQEIVNAVYTKDYPMIVCVFTISGFMTLVGYLVADILYAMVDPRISYSKK